MAPVPLLLPYLGSKSQAQNLTSTTSGDLPTKIKQNPMIGFPSNGIIKPLLVKDGAKITALLGILIPPLLSILFLLTVLFLGNLNNTEDGTVSLLGDKAVIGMQITTSLLVLGMPKDF